MLKLRRNAADSKSRIQSSKSVYSQVIILVGSTVLSLQSSSSAVLHHPSRHEKYYQTPTCTLLCLSKVTTQCNPAKYTYNSRPHPQTPTYVRVNHTYPVSNPIYSSKSLPVVNLGIPSPSSHNTPV
ncbi:hypothetical protein BDV19DRAFT_201205 [Aspergillus venezuelensis]